MKRYWLKRYWMKRYRMKTKSQSWKANLSRKLLCRRNNSIRIQCITPITWLKLPNVQFGLAAQSSRYLPSALKCTITGNPLTKCKYCSKQRSALWKKPCWLIRMKSYLKGRPCIKLWRRRLMSASVSSASCCSIRSSQCLRRVMKGWILRLMFCKNG